MVQHTLGDSRHRSQPVYAAGTAIGLLGLVAGFLSLVFWLGAAMLG